MKKRLIVLIAMVMTITMLSGCGASNEEALVYGSGDYVSINPALYEHGEINSLVFAGLTAHDKDNNIIEGLAEKWTWDEETLTYKFTLRENLYFHDGKKLTAEDVKFTLQTIMNPENVSEIASNYEDITNINVVDDKNIEITLAAPNAAMLDYLTIGIIPKHLLEGKDVTTDEFNHNPVGAGPYKLTSWDKGQSITLEKFDKYYRKEPKIAKIIFKIVENDQVKALQLESGELDLAQISPKSSEQFKGKAGYVVRDMKTADYRAIAYNFNSTFFSKHKELPNILSYAINREAIVKNVLLGKGQVAYSPLQKSQYSNDAINKYSYDPSKAETLLKEAGWSKNAKGYYEKNGEELAFTINNGQDDQVRIDMSNICAKNLQDIGVNATVKVNAETDWENQDSYLIGWGSPFDPDDHTYKVFGTEKGSNYTSYSNQKVDALLKEARELEKKEDRLPLYKEFQEELSKDLPYTFIAYIDAIYVAKDNIKGITDETVLGHHGVGIFWNVYDWEM